MSETDATTDALAQVARALVAAAHNEICDELGAEIRNQLEAAARDWLVSGPPSIAGTSISEDRCAYQVLDILGIPR